MVVEPGKVVVGKDIGLRGRIGRRARAMRIVGRISGAAATVGTSHPIKSSDSAYCAVTYRTLNLPQDGGGNRAYLASTPWDTLILALVGEV